MGKPFFSIIVPVYNVEKYLEECVKSIINQEDFSDYEVILVDDGSTDRSGMLCDLLAARNKHIQIKVIHQCNGGLSAARNAGIREAQGEYILFVDSDDYVAKNILPIIKETIENQNKPDVVFLEAIKIYSDGSMEPMGDGYKVEAINGKTHLEVLKHIAILPKFPGSACTKAIKREIFDNTLMFTEGLISEDVEWTYRLFGKAKKYAYCNKSYYFYRQQRIGSITSDVTSNKIESLLWIIEKWAQKDPKNKYRKIINSFVAYQYVVLILNLALFKQESTKEYYNRAAKVKWIMDYGATRKVRMVRLATRFLGLKLTGKLLKVYKQKKIMRKGRNFDD